MVKDYGTEVKLLAVTGVVPDDLERLTQESPEGEILIEYAGRLCYNVEDRLGSRTGWIQDRIKDGHESILEHASATFFIKASRVFTHELVRHRIASYSQRSQRYVNESEPKYITPPELSNYTWKVWSENEGMDYREWDKGIDEIFEGVMRHCWGWYKNMLEAGVPKEIARYVLPNACETQIVVTMNFRELRYFIQLRTSPRALPEMREVANKIKVICKDIAPEVFGDV